MTRDPVISSIKGALFLGNYLAAQSDAILQRYNIGCVVSVVEQPSRMPSPELCAKLDLWHFQFRIPDDEFEVEENELISAVFPQISAAESKPRQVLIHCHGGISRSPSLVITYLIWKYQMTFEKALQLVISRHPIANPKPLVLKSFLACLKMDLPENYSQLYRSRDPLQNLGRA